MFMNPALAYRPGYLCLHLFGMWSHRTGAPDRRRGQAVVSINFSEASCYVSRAVASDIVECPTLTLTVHQTDNASWRIIFAYVTVACGDAATLCGCRCAAMTLMVHQTGNASGRIIFAYVAAEAAMPQHSASVGARP